MAIAQGGAFKASRTLNPRRLAASAEETHLGSIMALSIVTGANRGIGFSLVRTLRERGAQVVAACRHASPELTELGVEVVTGVDVATQDGAEALRRAVGERPVDLLINNAGILVWGDQLDSPNFEGMRQQFEVNALGPVRITHALLGNFHEGTKIGFVTSRMGSVGDNESGGAYGYRMSKAALNIAAVSIARDLSDAGVLVAVLHPGMVKTDMIGQHGQIEPDEAAVGLLARLDALTPETSGSFWHQNGQMLPW